MSTYPSSMDSMDEKNLKKIMDLVYNTRVYIKNDSHRISRPKKNTHDHEEIVYNNIQIDALYFIRSFEWSF